MKKIKFLSSFLAFCLCFVLLSLNVKASEVADTTSIPETIQPVSLVTGEEDTTAFPSYDLTIPASTKSLVVPINVDYKGQLKIHIVGKLVTGGIDINLYSDEACTGKVGYSRYLSSGSLEDDIDADIPVKATYYLKFELSRSAEADSAVTITPYSFSSENKILKNKVWVGSHTYSYDSQISHKVTIDSPGFITVEAVSFTDGYSVYATLCDSKKAELSEQTYLSSSNSYTTYFAVKKGTYYINAKSSDDYKLRYTFTAVKENSSKTKQKAISIGKGKTLKGLVLSEDSLDKADWYKVKLSKSQILSLGIYAKSCDSIKFEIIPASDNITLFGSTVRIYDNGGDIYATKDKMPAGTYYIKVIKTDKTSSGYYTIKLN